METVDSKRRLTTTERIAAAFIGAVLLLAGLALYLWPPKRVSASTGPAGETASSSVPADPTNIVAVGLSVAGVLFIYALNGRRMNSFSAGNVEVKTDDEPSTTRESQGGDKEASATKRLALANNQIAQVVEDFYRLSSWNGKKALYACAIASRTGRPLDLRAICKADARMSFDYAYGYIVAASSFGMCVQQSDPEVRTIMVTSFEESGYNFLLKHIEGHLSIPPEDRERKAYEIRLITGLMGVPEPEFLSKIPAVASG
jgi:hypothetical protein